jgi:CheY-like chemotaxis protein
VARSASAAVEETSAVLYIEDSVSSALLVDHILRQLPDVRLDIARTAREALTVARRERYVLILTDLNLPDLSGADLLACLASDPSTRGVPICTLSATPRTDGPAPAGVVAHLGKPFRAAALIDVVNTVVGDRHASSAPTEQRSEAEPSIFERLKSSRPDRAAEITDRFIHSTSDEIVALRDAATANDRGRVSALSHRLKGTLGIFGAAATVRRLEELDSVVNGSPQPSWDHCLTAVEAAFADFVSDLERHRDRHDPGQAQ